MPGPNTTLITLYCGYMAGRAFSPYTIRRRTSSLSSFVKFIAPMDLTAVEGAHVEEWMSTLRAPRTRHAYRSDVAAFFTWAVRRRLVERNPVDDTDPIKVPKGLPRPVPIHAVPGIITAAGDPMLRLALALAAYAGLRRSEIVHLSTDDVQTIGQPMLVVRNGKGGRDRQVPLHPTLAAMLSERRTQGLYVPLSPDVLGRRARDHFRRLGYECSIHQLRHAFGTELARVLKGNVVAVGKAMGHESPNTSMNYIGWSGGDLAGLFGGMYGPAA